MASPDAAAGEPPGVPPRSAAWPDVPTSSPTEAELSDAETVATDPEGYVVATGAVEISQREGAVDAIGTNEGLEAGADSKPDGAPTSAKDELRTADTDSTVVGTAATPPPKEDGAGPDAEEVPQPDPPYMRADTSLRAWLVLLAGFSGTLWSAAYVASWGVYQRTLIAEGAFDGATNFQLSFVGTIVFSVSVITAIFIGPLVDRLHPALLQGIGSLCCATALFTGSYAVYLWNLYLSSVLYGIGGSLLYVPGTVMTNQWFSKRRGLAMGLMSSGTGIGTFVVTAISQACITAGGWRFSLRIVSAVVLGWMLPCSLLLKRRIPKVPRKGPFITLRYFKNLTFSLVFLGIVIIMFVFFMPQAYIPLMLFDGGYSNAAGAAVVSAYSAVMAVGRIAGGFLSSRAGEVNMFVLACAVPMVSALVWLAAPTNLGVTIAASMAWALFCGAPLVTMPLICAQEFGLGELGSVLGVMMLSFWPGETWGNAILGAIVDANTSYAPDGTRLGANYRPMLGFSAAVWFLGGAAIMVLRWKQVRWKVLVKV